VAVVLARSIVVDTCAERTTAKVFSTAVTVTSLATVVAPALGGQLLAHFDWRAPMFAMAALGILIVGFVWWIVPETLPVSRRTTVGVSRIMSTYGSLLRNRRFVAYAVVGASAGAIQFSYNTGAPGVLIEHYGMSARTCGLSLSAIALSMAVTSQMNALLLRWYLPKRILQVAVVVAALSSALVLVATFTGIGAAVGLIAVLLLQISMVGFIMANSMAGAMSSAGMHAGAASALFGVLMFALGTIGSALIGILHDSSGRLMGCVIATFSVVSLLISFRAGTEGGAPAAVGEDARPA
jgi:DHA1 family bicyclomycin/chloramphenicol resistance-like MFS transporter